MKNDTYGYARVSTREQREDRQMQALRERGVQPEDIFVDKQSGKDFNRPAYQRLMKKLKPGNLLFIKSIDRLGRNYEEVIEQWRVITKEKQVSVVVIDMPLLDTRKKDLDLTGSFIADLVLQILSYVAEKEREFIRQRQAEGIAVALAKGIRFGKPPTKRPDTFHLVHEAWLGKKISARSAAKQLGVTHPTFLTWASQTLSRGRFS